MIVRAVWRTSPVLVAALIAGCSTTVVKNEPTRTAQSPPLNDDGRQQVIDQTMLLRGGREQENTRPTAVISPVKNESAPREVGDTPGPTVERLFEAGMAAVKRADLTDNPAVKQTELTAAEQSFRAAIAIDPNHRRSLLALGNTVARLGRPEEATKFYTRAGLGLSPALAAAPPPPVAPTADINLRQTRADSQVAPPVPPVVPPPELRSPVAPPSFQVIRPPVDSAPPMPPNDVQPSLPVPPDGKRVLAFDFPKARSVVELPPTDPRQEPSAPVESNGGLRPLVPSVTPRRLPMSEGQEAVTVPPPPPMPRAPEAPIVPVVVSRPAEKCAVRLAAPISVEPAPLPAVPSVAPVAPTVLPPPQIAPPPPPPPMPAAVVAPPLPPFPPERFQSVVVPVSYPAVATGNVGPKLDPLELPPPPPHRVITLPPPPVVSTTEVQPVSMSSPPVLSPAPSSLLAVPGSSLPPTNATEVAPPPTKATEVTPPPPSPRVLITRVKAEPEH